MVKRRLPLVPPAAKGLAQRIRQLRSKKGWSQERLAEEAGIHRVYLAGTNESAIHWGIVKDLQSGGRIEFDGETVQKRPLGCLSTRSGLRGEHMFAFI